MRFLIPPTSRARSFTRSTTSIGAHPVPDGVAAVPLDATREEDVASAFSAAAASLGGIDALVNLAGFANRLASFDSLSEEEWEATVSGNLRAAFLCCKAGFPFLRQSPAGAIVNIASGQAVRPLPGFAPYSSSKSAVIALTKTIAAEGAPVRANVVAPGAVNTAFFTGGTGRPEREPSVDLRAYARTVPLGRAAEPADIVGPILFLLGPGAGFVNGQVLHVNGGGLMP